MTAQHQSSLAPSGLLVQVHDGDGSRAGEEPAVHARQRAPLHRSARLVQGRLSHVHVRYQVARVLGANEGNVERAGTFSEEVPGAVREEARGERER